MGLAGLIILRTSDPTSRRYNRGHANDKGAAMDARHARVVSTTFVGRHRPRFVP